MASYPYYELRPLPGKDYTKPLHVDCSVEYELPNSAKPPPGSKHEPLLMIHPSYYRREHNTPFINHLTQPKQPYRRRKKDQQLATLFANEPTTLWNDLHPDPRKSFLSVAESMQVCQEVNNNVSSSNRKSRTSTIQQPAVGIAAVSNYNPCLDSCFVPQRQRQPQPQPWSAITAPQFALQPPPLSSKYHKMDQQLAQKRSVPWSSKSTVAGPTTSKRTKTNHGLYSAVNFSQLCNNMNYATATAAAADCCKVCQQQQWNYTSHCRAVSSNTASSVIWNNENMLRLFQV